MKSLEFMTLTELKKLGASLGIPPSMLSTKRQAITSITVSWDNKVILDHIAQQASKG